jgi:hypothetical protein
MLSIPHGIKDGVYVKKKAIRRPFCVWFWDYITRPFRWVFNFIWGILAWIFGGLAKGCSSWIWGWIFFIIMLALFTWSLGFRVAGYAALEGMTRLYGYLSGTAESIPFDSVMWNVITANYSEPI